ncbi:hypothetical protein Droror1_Dr00027141 [Drosera rotundifolia]
MALVTKQRSSEHQSTAAEENQTMMRPLMLKEYLKFDVGIGSSSSSGFRSFPRRRDHHCCISVPNLIESELNRSKLLRSRSISATASSIILKLQRASVAILRAVSGGNARETKARKKYLLLPEMRWSLSRKVWKRRWWRSDGEDREENRRWGDSTTAKVGPGSCKSGDRWIEGEEDESGNGVVGKREELSVVTTVGEILAGATVVVDDKCKETCGNDQNNEQFSPVSVLDFHDDFEEGSSSPFICTLAAHFEGSKHNLVEKLSRFNCASSLQPVNLENRIAHRLAEVESRNLSHQQCTSPAQDKFDLVNEEVKQANQIEPLEKHLMNVVKGKVPSSKYFQFKPDNILIDFFKNSINENTEALSLKAAEDWLNGCYNDLLSGWEVKHKRQAYIDMEDRRRWTTDAERTEIAAELAAQVFASLSEELLLEICC